MTGTRKLMLTVAACLAPGLALQALLLSPAGMAANLFTAVLTAAITERACLGLRGVSPGLTVTDSDAAALVTALILAAALPRGPRCRWRWPQSWRWHSAATPTAAWATTSSIRRWWVTPSCW